MTDDQNSPAPPPGENTANREAMERLNESNRVLLEARMLPRSQPLNADRIAGVVDAFKRYIKAHDVRPAQVAREIKYSPAVLSSWMRGKYKGDVDTVTHSINDWMERDSRRSEAQRPKDYVETWVAETMRTIACEADKLGMMAAIVAPAGSGKTLVLKALADEMRGVYLYCDADHTTKDFLESLAAALGRKAQSGTTAKVKQFVIESLRGTRRIIFLDEAHQLGKAIKSIRGIYDQAEVPIVMAGTADILNMIADHADGRGQFHSRCIPFNVVDQIRDVENPDRSKGGRNLFTIEEIRAFFSMKKIRLSNDALMLMWQLACLPSRGTLRLIDTLATLAFELNRRKKDEALTRDQVVEALRLLRGNSGSKHLRTLAERHADNGAVAKVA